MVRDIENYIYKCSIFARYQNKNIKEPLLNHEISGKLFTKLGIDIGEYGEVGYLIINDYDSKWLDIKKLYNKSADSVIKALKSVFCCFEIPKLCITDNISFSNKDNFRIYQRVEF